MINYQRGNYLPSTVQRIQLDFLGVDTVVIEEAAGQSPHPKVFVRISSPLDLAGNGRK